MVWWGAVSLKWFSRFCRRGVITTLKFRSIFSFLPFNWKTKGIWYTTYGFTIFNLLSWGIGVTYQFWIVFEFNTEVPRKQAASPCITSNIHYLHCFDFTLLSMPDVWLMFWKERKICLEDLTLHSLVELVEATPFRSRNIPIWSSFNLLEHSIGPIVLFWSWLLLKSRQK